MSVEYVEGVCSLVLGKADRDATHAHIQESRASYRHYYHHHHQQQLRFPLLIQFSSCISPPLLLTTTSSAATTTTITTNPPLLLPRPASFAGDTILNGHYSRVLACKSCTAV